MENEFLFTHSLINLFYSSIFIYNQFYAWQGFCEPRGKRKLTPLGFFLVDLKIFIVRSRSLWMNFREYMNFLKEYTKNEYLYFPGLAPVTFFSPFVGTLRRSQYREKNEPWSLIIVSAALLILGCLDITGFKLQMPSLVALWLNLNLNFHMCKTGIVMPTSHACFNNACQKASHSSWHFIAT